MTSPTWLDPSPPPTGPRVRELRAGGRADAHLRDGSSAHGLEPGRTLLMPDWCGCTMESIRAPGRGG